MHGRNFRLKLARMLTVIVMMTPAARGDDASRREYKIKAAFVYNFAQFVQWPDSAFASPEAPFVVVVVGKEDPFDGLLDLAVGGKRVGTRRAVVQHFDSIDQIGPCQILFISVTDDPSLSQILQKFQGRPVLTIGENDNMCVLGGCCRFFTEEERLRFEVNREAVDDAGLKISSKLLKLARIYRKQ